MCSVRVVQVGVVERREVVHSVTVVERVVLGRGRRPSLMRLVRRIVVKHAAPGRAAGAIRVGVVRRALEFVVTIVHVDRGVRLLVVRSHRGREGGLVRVYVLVVVAKVLVSGQEPVVVGVSQGVPTD